MDFSGSTNYAQEISLPLFYDLTFEEQNSVVEIIHSAFNKNI